MELKSSNLIVLGVTAQEDDDVFDDDAMPSVAEAEAMAAEEVGQVLKGFRARAKQDDKRLMDAVDSEYWIAVCFQTREQKEEFLSKAGWAELGDKYLDGMAVARAMKIKLESRIPSLPRLKIDRVWARLTGGWEDADADN